MSEAGPLPAEHRFDLSGGHLGLDFANTLGRRGTAEPAEHLGGYRDLLSWSVQAGCLGAPAAAGLARRAEAHPAGALAVLGRGLALRETIYRLFSAVAAGRPPAPEDLAGLNRELASALPHLRIEARPEGFSWSWAAAQTALDEPLWPVARAAAELLTSPQHRRVRECAAAECGWLFLDRSRNASRRWCDMKVCGNRAKARRHYRRSRR